MTMIATGWRPATDVYVTPTTVDVTLEIAGVAVEDVRVRLSETTIVIEGRRRFPDEVDARGAYHMVEIRRGAFRAEITLPAQVEANPRELHNEMGLLRVRFNRTDPYHRVGGLPPPAEATSGHS